MNGSARSGQRRGAERARGRTLWLRCLALAALLGIGALAPARSALAQVEANASSRRSTAEALAADAQRQVSTLESELRRRSALHEALVQRLEDFRGKPIQAFRLAALQAQARALADEVASLETRLRQARADRSAAHRLLEAALEEHLRGLAAQGASVAGPQRRAWLREQEETVARLEVLRRESSAGRVPRLPEAASGLSGSAAPEDLREQADELADLRERYLRHTQDLERRIASLREQQRLVKLARDLAREEGLFDEAMRYRKLGRATTVRTSGEPSPSVYDGSGRGSSTVPGKTDPSPDGAVDTPPPGGGGGSPQDPDPSPADTPDAPSEGDDSPSDRGEWNDPNGAAEGDGDSYDGFDGELAVGGAPEPADPAGPQDDALTGITVPTVVDPGPRVTLQEDLDPSSQIEGQRSLGRLDLASQLRVLQRDRQRAAAAARSLEQRVERLRRQATELEREGGW